MEFVEELEVIIVDSDFADCVSVNWQLKENCQEFPNQAGKLYMYYVGDFILRVKNAYMARKQKIDMPYSNIVKAVAKLLVKEGFIAGVEEIRIDEKRVLTVNLRYENRKPAMHDVKLISKPSLRVYVDLPAISADKDKALTSIISSSKGVITGKEAVKKRIGGELLFKIW